VVAAAGVLFVTQTPGPGLEPDSMSYLGAAESLVQTGRLSVPTTGWSDDDSSQPLHHFPPGFSLAIAIPMKAGLSAVQSARIVMAIAAGATVATITWLAGLLSGMAGSVVVVLLFVLFGALSSVHLEVLSEPAFLACLALTLALMVTAPRRPLWYGITAAIGLMVRYAGVALSAAAVVWAFRGPGSTRERVRGAVLAGLPSAILGGAWVLRTLLVDVEIRQVGVYPNLRANLALLATTLADELVPIVGHARLQWLLLPVTLLALIALIRGGLARARQQADDPRPLRLFQACGVLAVSYVAVLVFARLFADPGIPFDGRLLSPLCLLLVLVMTCSLVSGWVRWERSLRAVVAVALGAWGVGSAMALWDRVDDALTDGLGYASQELRDTPLAAWLGTEGRRYAIFSNHPMIVYFRTGRPSREFPDWSDSAELADFADVLEERHGVVVGFKEEYRPLIPAETLAARLGLVETLRSPDGSVWMLPPKP
jgi:hypothetical protein